MAGKKEPGVQWRHTTVLVRTDIFESAREHGLDISNTCNQALAEVLGIDYHQQRLDDVPVPHPVIIAKEGGLPAMVIPGMASTTAPRQPVINADDPAAAGTIAQGRKQVVRKPVPEIPPHAMTKTEDTAPEPPAKKTEKISPAKPKKTPAKKAEKGDGLKRFIATKIVRDDADTAVIPKEELYQVFSRWCREQKISPVPEAKAVTVALKTRFAFKDKVVGGASCWTSLRFR
jgi:hypothetical protein